jgi:hypothetical protein
MLEAQEEMFYLIEGPGPIRDRSPACDPRVVPDAARPHVGEVAHQRPKYDFHAYR